MKIELQNINIRDLVNGYENNDENGVVAYGGKLDVRPPYQREFIYKNEQQQAVIQTVSKGFPLNVMYWATRDDGTFEIIDGQQRTISICEYIIGNFSVVFSDPKYPQKFEGLTSDKQKQILDYQLTIYVCTGEPSEKLDWFRTINIAGERLTEQELRNAVYSGSFVTEAKKKFSKSNCVAFKKGHDYMSGTPIRQDYLETVIKWISNGKINEYMLEHQHDTNADELWLYFQNIIDWVKTKFPNYRKQMKAVQWGEVYNIHKNDKLDASKLEERISKLMMDGEIQKGSGIYWYVLDGDERHLDLRKFDEKIRRVAYERQGGYCPRCHKHFDIEQMEADHITPWCDGGRTIAENCQMLCKECNRRKSGK